MKKVILSFTMIALSWAMIGQANPETAIVVEDFDENRNLDAFIGDNGTFFNSFNEAPGSEDNTVGRYNLDSTVLVNRDNFIGTRVKNGIMDTDPNNGFQGYNIDEYPFFSIDVYSDEPFNLQLRIEDAQSPDGKTLTAQDFQDYTLEDINTWQTLFFDLTEAQGIAGSDNELVFGIDLFNESDEKVLFFDNFTAFKLDPITGLKRELNLSNNKVEIYPNPASSKVTFSYSELEGKAELIEIYSSTGQLLETVTLDGINTSLTSIETADFEPGIYSVRIISNQEYVTSQFVVNK